MYQFILIVVSVVSFSANAKFIKNLFGRWSKPECSKYFVILDSKIPPANPEPKDEVKDPVFEIQTEQPNVGTRERLEQLISQFVEGTKSVAEQIYELSCTAGSCSIDYTKVAIKRVPGALWRIWRFEGDLKSFKDGIIFPILGILREFREKKEDPNELAKVLGKFTILDPEIVLKLQSSLLPQVKTTLTNVGGVLIGIPSIKEPTLIESLVASFRTAFVSHAIKVMFTKNMPLMEKLKKIQDTEEQLLAFIENIKDDLGIKDVDSELSAWMDKNS